MGSLILLLSLQVRPAAAADDPKRAKELFQEGTTFFDVGQFDKAIEAWQAGYKAKPDPGFLYNIAQAYRIAGDPNKAIFFYRGYLRNSPNAENRTEVEQKIAALQKQLAELDRNKPSVPPPATTPPPPAAASSTSSPPPLAAADPTTAVPPSAPTTYPSATLAPPPSVGTADVAAAGPPAGDDGPGHFDLTAVLGVDTWQEGFQGAAQPSFAFVIGGGYTLGGRPDRRLQFHVGALIGYTFLSEKESTPKFWSWMVEPMLRYRLGERWALSGALGIGVLAISGLAPNSVLLAPPSMGGALMVNGTQSLLVTRPALGVEFRLTDSLAILMTFAFPYSPKGENFHGPIRRSEVLFGLGYHL